MVWNGHSVTFLDEIRDDREISAPEGCPGLAPQALRECIYLPLPGGRCHHKDLNGTGTRPAKLLTSLVLFHASHMLTIVHTDGRGLW